MNIFKAFALVILFFTANLVFSQTYKKVITGRIVGNSNKPLENINVTVKNTSVGTVSDKKGRFSLSVKTDKTTIVVTGIGFKSKDINIDFAENTTVNVNIVLNTKTYDIKEVSVSPEKSLLDNNISKAREVHLEIPGGTNLFELKTLHVQSSQTLKEAMRLVPGIHIQEYFGGNDQPRLNIRGAGIQSNPPFRGIELLQDGISTNFSDGTFIMGMLEPRAANYMEVFRGANGFKYGVATLGGAINLVSKDGYTASPLAINIQGGSFDYIGGSISSGKVLGKSDYYASLSYNKTNGFRDFNHSSRLNALLNFGHKFSERLENRTYITFTDIEFDVPGPLTQAELEDNPKQNTSGVIPSVSIGPNVVRDKPGRKTKVFRVANKTRYLVNENSFFTAGIYYQYVDDVFKYPITTGFRESKNNDLGISLYYNNEVDKNKFVAGVNASTGTIDRKFFINKANEKTDKYADNELRSNNIYLLIEDVYKISPELSAVAALQISYNERNNKDRFETPEQRPFYDLASQSSGIFSSSNTSVDNSYTGFNPKLGLIYAFNKGSKLFFNLSRSYEPPTFDELIKIAGSNPKRSPGIFESVDLDDQTATTFEIGTKGKSRFLSWDLCIYRSWVKNEILTTTDDFSIAGVTRNSKDKTIHQGLELGLGIRIFENLFSVNGDKLSFNAVYNYNDFYFNEGIYDGKQIAGVPKHYIYMNLDYNHPCGVFTEINMESLPKKTPTDHQNTLFQKEYYLFGFRLGYNKNRYGFFVEAKNITDQKYASSYIIRDVVPDPPPATMRPNEVSTFIPGSGKFYSRV